MNRAVLTGLAGIALAQGLKIPIELLQTGKLNWKAFAQSGGMPSSHSSGVAALSTYVALKKGVSAVDFAICTIFGLIVMYDAMGIRRHAGEMAVELNELDVQVEKLVDRHPGLYHERREQALKEKLGHIPQEVAAGAVLGTAVGFASRALEIRRWWMKPR